MSTTSTTRSTLGITDPAEQQVQLALRALVESGLNRQGYPNLSIRKAALTYNVSLSKLTARWNGRRTRVEAHAHQQLLTPPQELVLKEWIKSLALRGVPLSSSSVAEYAAVILGAPVSQKWVYAFRKRHPDIVARWTSGLESCRARALNKTQVDEFYDILNDLSIKFNIKPHNIYNMDEKGVQMGVGKRTKVLVDRDQKSVQQLENGNRELVTVIEVVSADGFALHPSVIFKGKKRNLSWAENNPCNASISVSPNGWTDMDLGLKWLMYDFHPASNERNPDKEWRMLILDGHNSHCSYAFVDFCEKHQIVLLCLPSHTTHRLQPCDVGVFGPLASCWKAEVNEASRKNIAITKYNLLEVYSRARDRAFTQTTIQSAFRKTGIFPFDPSVIEETAFSPALNTTTQAAQPVPATLPALLTEVNIENVSSLSPATATAISSGSTLQPLTEDIRGSSDTISHSSSPSENPASPSHHPRAAYTLLEFPSPLPANASTKSYLEQNRKLREFAESAKSQMEADYASKKLMDAENGRLRAELFGKKKTYKKREGGSGARHMTGPEMIEALAKSKWEDIIAEFHQLAAPRFKKIRADIAAQERTEAEQKKKDLRDEEIAQKAAIKEEQKKIKATLAFIVKRIARAQRDARRELAIAQKAWEAAEKKAAREAKHMAAKQRREEKEQERTAAKQKKELAKQKGARTRAQKPASVESAAHVDIENEVEMDLAMDFQPQMQPTPLPRPRPRPRARHLNVVEDVHVQNQGPTIPTHSQPFNCQEIGAEGGLITEDATKGMIEGAETGSSEQMDGQRRSRRLATKRK